MTGGTAEEGILRVPWVPLVVWAALIVAIALAIHVRHGGTLAPREVLSALRKNITWRVSLPGRLLVATVWVVPLLAFQLFVHWDPLSAAEPIGPGPLVAEVRDDGVWEDDSVQDATSGNSSPHDCVNECPGPRYVYRIKPGDTYSYLATIKNEGQWSVTLLGRRAYEGAPSAFGIALLRDPGLASVDPANLVPFHAVELTAGASVSFAMVNVAESCANPEAKTNSWGRYATGYPFVYELWGWRRTGYVYPHFSVTVAGCE